MDFEVQSVESWLGLLGLFLVAISLMTSRRRLDDPSRFSRLFLRLGLVSLILVSTFLTFRAARVEIWATLIVGGVVAIILLIFDYLPSWSEKRKAKILAHKGLNEAPSETGYFRLTPYSSSARDRKAYRRPDSAEKRVRELILEAKSPLLFLTGRSGTGKSSLLLASVLPSLERRRTKPWVAIFLRSYNSPTEELVEALRKTRLVGELTSAPEVLQPRYLLEQACSSLEAKAPPARLLLIIDQFEEFLALPDEAERRKLECLFRSLVEQPVQSLTVLLSLRSDYIGRLQELSLPQIREGGLDNWIELSAFTEPQGREFLQRSGLKIGPRLLDDVLQEAVEIEETHGLVRPITLNLIGLILNRSTGRLPRNFRAGKIITAYLKEVIESSSLWPATPRILRFMLSPEGSRQPRRINEIEKEAGLSRGTVRGILLSLANQGLVRSLDTRGETWEISHDFLAHPLRLVLARLEMSFWRRLSPWLAPAMLGAWLVAILYGLPTAREILILHKIGPLGAEVVRDKNEILMVRVRRQQRPLELESLVRWLLLNDGPIELDLSADFFSFTARADVKNLDPLQRLHQLRSLDLGYTEVVDLTPLSSLKELLVLDLFRSKVIDLSPLSTLTQLEDLRLLDTRVVDLRPLSTLGNMKYLNLAQTEVVDIAPLQSLTSLRELHLGDTKISDLEPLRHLNQLEELSLYDTAVTNLEPLRSLSQLRSLSLTNTKVKDLTPLDNLPALKELYLSSEVAPSIKAQAEQLKNTNSDLRIH